MIIDHKRSYHVGIEYLLLCCQHDRHSVCYRNKFFHYRKVERQRRDRKTDISALGVAEYFVVLLICINEVHKVVVREHNALGLSGGTRCVDNISKRLIRNIDIQIISAFA